MFVLGKESKMTTLICTFAVLIDRLVGDPKKRTHPVVWIGQLISALDKWLNKGTMRKLKGFVCVGVVLLITGGVVASIVYVSYYVHWIVGVGVEIVLISLALAQKSLEEAAMRVYNALQQEDFSEARDKLGWIVGRDTAHLDESEIVRGVVETVSENTSDGVTAPLFYALLFGATGAWIYKAINTMDSMIAYKNERYGDFGFVAAKLDDIANFIPSRVTGLLILIGTKTAYKMTLRARLKRWIIDAKKHPSPNSGYLEAATALQLGIRLGGVNSYGSKSSFRAYMGDLQTALTRTHITQSVRHMYIVTMYFLILIGGICLVLSSTWS